MRSKIYSPEESLQRIKLMMEYDVSKTSDENKQKLSEQVDPGTAVTTGVGAGLGYAAAGTVASAIGYGATAGSVVPVVGTAAGALIGLGLGMLGKWIATKDLGRSGFEQVMSACKSPGVKNLVPKMSKAEIRNLAYAIEDAKGDWNDDEDAIASALQRVESVADLCALDKKVPGGLLAFLDSVTDSPSEWKMFTRPLAGMIEDSEVVIPDTDQSNTDKISERQKNINNVYCSVKNGIITVANPKLNGTKWSDYMKKYSVTNDEISKAESSCFGGGRRKGGSSFTPCPANDYKRGCKSDVVRKVQACLGMVPKYQTGNFGPITQGELAKLGKGFENGFKDADVDVICKRTTVVEPPKGEELEPQNVASTTNEFK